MIYKHIFLLFLGLLCTDCSHFRGGYITWKPIDNSQIAISYRVAFRRSSPGNFCDQDSKANGTLVSGEGDLDCFSGCSGRISNMSYYCTDFSVSEDWSMGTRTVKYTPQSSLRISLQFGYESCCWISLVVNGDSSWRLISEANLGVRTDKGTINSSPVTAMQPIIRFSYGCNHRLRIPVADDDGDVVRCRWAHNNECGGVCESFPGSHLDETDCTLEYNATDQSGWYAVAIQIEDFKTASDTSPLSSIPLQFLVYVSNSSSSCSDKPVLPTKNTIPDGSKQQLNSGSTFNQTIIAKSTSPENKITEINTVTPQGMTKTELVQKSSSEWSVQVVWKPTPDQAGSHVFCYSAVDSSGHTSDQSCSTLVVDGKTNETTANSGNIIELDSTCRQPKDPNAIKNICANAATKSSYFHETSCSTKYIECTPYGTGFVMSCPAALVWCHKILTCTGRFSCNSG